MKESGAAYEPPKSSPWLMGIVVVAILLVLFVVSMGPMRVGGIKQSPQNARLQTAHAIGLALYSYANDNDQQYPHGASSTEAFQELLDGGYVTDPTIFYIPMPGKIKPVAGQKLKPENVSWDLTAPVGPGSSTSLPLLFMTGYKISYVPGGAAVPFIKPVPQYAVQGPPPSWFDRTFANKSDYAPSTGIAVFYVNNSAVFVVESNVRPGGTLPNFVPLDFKPDGKTYRQLTPDGVLQ